MSKEVWKEVVEFADSYEVSNKGNVRSVDRVVIRSNGRPITVNGKDISIMPDKDGYSIVQLYKDGRRYVRKVHRMVYEAFVGELSKDLVIDHRDNDKSINSVENLQQVTNRFNVSKDRKRSLPTGVYLNANGGGFKVQFQANNVSVYIGTYSTIKSANKAYKDALKGYKEKGVMPTEKIQRHSVIDGKKICSLCFVEKPMTDYYWANKSKGLKHSKCKECYKE
jgi:hypothetical protein